MVELADDFNLKDYQNWYNHVLVKKSLVYHFMYREGSALGTKISIRNMKIRDASHLKENFDRFSFMTEPTNLYYSLAILDKMPIFSFNIEERKAQSKAFIPNFHKFVVGYDIGLDFDSKECGFDTAYKEMKTVHKWLMHGYCAHFVRFSGSGFHITIPSNYMWVPPFRFRKALAPSMCGVVANLLSKKFGLESIDMSVYDERRIWKIPYSIDIKTGNVCRPLSEFEINHFNHEIVQVKYCFKNFREIFFNRKMVKGSGRAIHKLLLDSFSPKYKTSMKIWKLIETEGVDAADYAEVERGW